MSLSHHQSTQRRSLVRRGQFKSAVQPWSTDYHRSSSPMAEVRLWQRLWWSAFVEAAQRSTDWCWRFVRMLRRDDDHLVDKHAPFADIKIRSHHNAPWYDNECRTRRLECFYRDKKLEPDRAACMACTDQTSAFRLQREVRSLLVSGYQKQYRWSKSIVVEGQCFAEGTDGRIVCVNSHFRRLR